VRNETFEHFFDEGLIEKVLLPLKQGKEASVHLCRANPRTTGEELAALKIYHPLDRRDFRDEGLYRDGEFIKERRVRVALERKTAFGRQVQGSIWVSREWETLKKLWAVDAPVPRPIEGTDDAILMTYIGDVGVPAPRLQEYEHEDRDELEAIWDQLYRAIQHLLYRDVVHGDLSAYNVLVWDGELTLIDFRRPSTRRRTGTRTRSWSGTSCASASGSSTVGSTGRGSGSRRTCGPAGRSRTSCPRSCAG